MNAFTSIINAITAFGAWLYNFVLYCLGYISAVLIALFLKLISLLDYLFETILSPFWTALLSFVSDINLTAFSASYYYALSSVSGLEYFLSVFQVPLLISSVLTASVIKFLIRRIPVIG